jgi:D-alanine-D-alanine ligase-like ATP-grasp enzyme
MKKAFATPILQKLSRKAGVKIVMEPTYKYAGQITLPDGTRSYFLRTNFDLNSLGASEIAKDKSYASFFLQRLGYPTIEGESFFSPEWNEAIKMQRGQEAAYRYAQKIGLPVIVKPNSLSQGVGVAKVYNKREFVQAARAIYKKDRVFLVQREVKGRDYRVVVLDNEVISAYERLPLSVRGNGVSTITQLIQQKQEVFRCAGRDTNLEQEDVRITNRLKRIGYNRNTVLPKGETIALLDSRNLSSGGDAIDVTKQIHPEFERLCISITRDMGLRYCGVDLMVSGDIRQPVGKYWVIEINAAPGIDNYASTGLNQEKIVEQMYMKVLCALAKKSLAA